MKGKNSIVIIMCYFGKIPWYFEYFLHSCRYNPTVQFYFITDNEKGNMNFPENVIFIKKSLNDIKENFSLKLGFEVLLDSPYKFCDLRPALGHIFPDLIQGYKFWGYGDIDVIYGNIRKFITDKMMSEFDVISVRHDFIPGMFSVFRNRADINELFRQSKDYRKVFSDTKHYCFDETNFSFDGFADGLLYKDIASEVESMTHLVRRLQEEKRIKAYFDFHVIEGLPGKMKWDKGTLTYNNTIEAILYHLIKLKKIYSPHSSPNRIPDTFYISPSRIYHR